MHQDSELKDLRHEKSSLLFQGLFITETPILLGNSMLKESSSLPGEEHCALMSKAQVR
jgi:hypothetical protein